MSKAELIKLQAMGIYVFHGSVRGDLHELTPRQAYSHGKPDGKPCIAASERIEPPIFMAVLGSRYVGGWGKGKIEQGQFGFFAERSDYEKAKQERWSGYIYVLNKSDFAHLSSWEWRAYKSVRPVKVIAVDFSDLPEDITLE
jgi:hypothetical protein